MKYLPTELKAPVRAAEALGWTYDRTRKNHPRLTPPPGTRDPRSGELMSPVIFASTASCPRSIRNSLAQLKRAGVCW